MGALKEVARKIMMAPRKKEYEERLSALSNTYDAFMREQEAELLSKKESGRESTLTYTEAVLEEGMKKSSFDIIIYYGKEGLPSPVATLEICKAFEENPEAVVVYADEDSVICTKDQWQQMMKKGVPVSARSNPRIKPVYSPETLVSYFYPGNIVAIKSAALDMFVYTEGESVYDVLLRNRHLLNEENVYHLPLILYHAHRLPGEDAIFFDEGDVLRKKSILNDTQKMDFVKGTYLPAYYSEEDKLRLYPLYELPKDIRLSIVIPSKDNPDVLLRCIDSVRNGKTSFPVEIIVVDNGSSDENKAKIEEASKEKGFLYIYEKEEFNYSHMNNVGASIASGNILLLLNDDMEMVSPDALDRMAGQLLCEGVGIVGAKLLYPNSSVIQHIGITNAVDGPVHKFIGKEDDARVDYKRNRFVHNCIGATGACLMIRKSDFDAVGGLKEDLRIAYNDVDLCFSIRERKLRCVIRPDAVFYHHESLSRGADHLSDEKLKRLYAERKMLYSFHPDIYTNDPYEGMASAGGTELSFDTENRFNKKKPAGECPKATDFDYHQYPEGIIVHFDRLEKEEILRSEGEEFYVIQGYHVVPHIDNMRFRFRMIFEGKKGTYEMPMPGYLRMNLEGGYPEATNLKLSGFCNFVTRSELPADTYEIGIFADDCLKKLYLYQRTKQVLIVEE